MILIIILTHTNFFYTDNSQVTSGNIPLEETFVLIDLFEKHNVTLVLQGHEHYRKDLTYGKVRYTVLGAIEDNSKAPEYVKVNVGPEGLELDWQYIR